MDEKIFFSDKELKTIAELKAIGGINLPVFKDGTKMYKTSLCGLLSENYEFITYYLDAENGNDANSGLIRNHPVKSVSALITKVRLQQSSYKFRLVILNSSNASGNIVTFNGDDFGDSETKSYPFWVTECESDQTSLIFTNGVTVGLGGFFIKCLKNITLTGGISISAEITNICANNIELSNHGSVAGSLIKLNAAQNVHVFNGDYISSGFLNIRAGKDVRIHDINLLTCQKVAIRTDGDVVFGLIQNGTDSREFDIEAKNIILPESAGLTIGSENPAVLENLKTMTWVARDSIEIEGLFLKFGTKNIKFQCNKLNITGFINATGNLFIDTDELNINNNISNISNTSLNLFINAKKASFLDTANIAVNSPKIEGYDEVSIKIGIAPIAGFIDLKGRLNALVEVDEVKGSFECYMNAANAALTGSKRRLIERAKTYQNYDAVIRENGSQSSYDSSDQDTLAADLKSALESTEVRTIYLAVPVSLNEDVVLGCDKKIFGEEFSFSGIMSGSHDIKFYCSLYSSSAVFYCNNVYARRTTGIINVAGFCHFNYELIVSGSINQMSETASVAFNAWDTTVIAAQARKIDIIPYGCCMKDNEIGVTTGIKGYLNYFSPDRDLKLTESSSLSMRYPMLTLPSSTNVTLAIYRIYKEEDAFGVVSIDKRLIAISTHSAVSSHSVDLSNLTLFDYGDEPTGTPVQNTATSLIIKEGEEYAFAIYSEGDMLALGLTIDSDVQNACNGLSFSITGVTSITEIPYKITIADACGAAPTYACYDSLNQELANVVVAPSNKINYGQIRA